jgi:hypothetical protein
MGYYYMLRPAPATIKTLDGHEYMHQVGYCYIYGNNLHKPDAGARPDLNYINKDVPIVLVGSPIIILKGGTITRKPRQRSFEGIWLKIGVSLMEMRMSGIWRRLQSGDSECPVFGFWSDEFPYVVGTVNSGRESIIKQKKSFLQNFMIAITFFRNYNRENLNR